MVLPSDNSARFDRFLHRQIASEIHSLTRNLRSLNLLSIDDLECEVERLDSLILLFTRRYGISLLDGQSEDQFGRLQQRLLAERSRLSQNFHYLIALLAQSLRIRQESLHIKTQFRRQVEQVRKLSIPTPLTPLNLLIVDDHDTCEMLEIMLGISGYKVVTVRSKVEALECLSRRTFDLCILERWLSDGSGIELCREIRTFDTKMQIVFYSGFGSEPDRQAGFKAGAQEYLIKPVEMEELEQTIALLLGDSERMSAEV